MKEAIGLVFLLCVVGSGCSTPSSTSQAEGPGKPVVVHCTTAVTVLHVERIEIEDPDHSHRETLLRQATVRNTNGDVGEVLLDVNEQVQPGDKIKLCEYRPRNPLPGSIGFTPVFLGTTE